MTEQDSDDDEFNERIWRALNQIPDPPHPDARSKESQFDWEWSWTERSDENVYSRYFDVRKWEGNNNSARRDCEITVGAEQVAVFDADWQRITEVSIRNWAIWALVDGGKDISSDDARQIAGAFLAAADELDRRIGVAPATTAVAAPATKTVAP
ncbi:hypothetical protein [Mycobacterium sp.]|uniref:hypothetical protein n=1 Tax=Mycobacterium sp. TaxID=1785 RepID=UPI003F969EFA